MSESATTHPEMERLIALASGECEDVEQVQLRTHLADCGECTQLYLDFRSFDAEELTEAATEITDEDIETEFHQLMNQVDPAPTVVDLPISKMPLPFYRRFHFAYGMAAVFFLTSILLIFKIFILFSQTEQSSHVNAYLESKLLELSHERALLTTSHVNVYLESKKIERSHELTQVTASHSDALSFELQYDGFQAEESYLLKLSDASGRIYYSHKLMVKDGLLTPLVQKKLPSGNYVFNVYNADSNEITSFPFQFTRTIPE